MNTPQNIQTNIKIIFFYLLVSSITTSCGLFNSGPDTPTTTESTKAETQPAESSEVDDLFANSENKTELKSEKSDSPVAINTETGGDVSSELKSMEDDFAPKNETPKTPTPPVQIAQIETPIKIEEEVLQHIPDKNEESENAGGILNYKVKKGETLMQVAFKLYGDISKWKSLRSMNNNVSALHAGMKLKYKVPKKKFFWKPDGSPHLIKTGETLGTISNEVYQTPKKWKSIWENNKPLIKNPNVIYAGFTLYYKKSDMAVSPLENVDIAKENIEIPMRSPVHLSTESSESLNVKNTVIKPTNAPTFVKNEIKENAKTKSEIDENKIDEAITKLESQEKNSEEVIDLTTETQAAIDKKNFTDENNQLEND